MDIVGESLLLHRITCYGDKAQSENNRRDSSFTNSVFSRCQPTLSNIETNYSTFHYELNFPNTMHVCANLFAAETTKRCGSCSFRADCRRWKFGWSFTLYSSQTHDIQRWGDEEYTLLFMNKWPVFRWKWQKYKYSRQCHVYSVAIGIFEHCANIKIVNLTFSEKEVKRHENE